MLTIQHFLLLCALRSQSLSAYFIQDFLYKYVYKHIVVFARLLKLLTTFTTFICEVHE